ncbi:MAG: hypothetical protein WC628_10065 [Candidatus Omnitrophota bacterium]
MYKFHRGFGLLEILLALVVIMLLYFVSLKLYFKKTISDVASKKLLSQQGINTSSYSGVLASVKESLKAADKKNIEREKAIEGAD